MDLHRSSSQCLNYSVGWWFRNLYLLVSSLNFRLSSLNRFWDASILGVDYCCGEGGSFVKVTRDLRIISMVSINITTLIILNLMHYPHLLLPKSRIFLFLKFTIASLVIMTPISYIHISCSHGMIMHMDNTKTIIEFINSSSIAKDITCLLCLIVWFFPPLLVIMSVIPFNFLHFHNLPTCLYFSSLLMIFTHRVTIY